MWSAPDHPWQFWLAEFAAPDTDLEGPADPWSDHRDFAYDLIRWRQPETVVELGTHHGTSFLTFCQAAQDGGADTELHAIDTWQGDEQTGSYGPEVLARFSDALERYPRVRAFPHQTTFREALAEFADESIDLLHIDGLHTSEALQDDFQSWLPKVATDGLVLVHDVAPGNGHGSAEYYARAIAEVYPGFAFTHDSGLAVVLPKGTGGWDYLLSDEFARWRLAYARSAEARRLVHQAADLADMVAERDALIASYDERFAEQAGEIERLEWELDSRRNVLRASEAQMRSAEDRVRAAEEKSRHLERLAYSPRAQLGALRRTVPRQVRLRTQAMMAKRAAKRAGIEPQPARVAPPNPAEFIYNSPVSLEDLVRAADSERFAADRAGVDSAVFAGTPITADQAEDMAVRRHSGPLDWRYPDDLLPTLHARGQQVTAPLAELVEGEDPELLTIDIWDTLILRNRPPDAAKTATGRRMALIPHLLPGAAGSTPFDLMAQRNGIEARMAADHPGGEYELTEVLARQLQELGHPDGPDLQELATELAQREVDDEIAWSWVREEVLNLVLQRGDKALLASDFYMKGTDLQRLVNSVTGEELETVVSIDRGVSKRVEGELLKQLRAERGVAAERHLHLGDNVHADVNNQVATGGAAIHTPRWSPFPEAGTFSPGHLSACWAELDRQLAAYNEDNPTDDLAVLAGREAGLLAVVLVLRGLEEAWTNNLDRVHYVSREGIFLSEVHNLIEPILRPPRAREVRPIHLALSRRATFGASLDEPYHESLQRMWSMYREQSVTAMLVSIGVDPDLLTDQLARQGLTPSTRLFDPGRDKRILAFLNDPSTRRILGQELGRARELLRDYVLQRTNLDNRFIVIDIGWRGTIQDNLVRALGITDSVGIYLGMFPVLNPQPLGSRKVGVCFDGNLGEEFLFAEPPAALERPWTPDVPSTVAFTRGPDGEIVPTHDKESGHVSPGIAAFQAGTIEVAPLIAEWFNGMGLTTTVVRNDLGDRAFSYWMDPPPGSADIWFDSDHDDSFGALNETSFSKLAPDQTWYSGPLRDHLIYGERASMWAPGYRAWRPVRGIISLARTTKGVFR